MQLSIRYKKNRKLSEGLEDHIRQKMQPIEERLETDHPIHVILESEKTGEHAEVSFHYRGHDIITKTQGKNLYEAIDDAVSKAERRLTKIAQKLNSHKGDVSIRGMEEPS